MLFRRFLFRAERRARRPVSTASGCRRRTGNCAISGKRCTATAASGITKSGAKIGSRKNGLDVVVRDGVAFLPDFTSFAGSVVTCDKMLYNMLHLTGMSLPDCVKTLTETPARILGYSRTKGRIADGYDADMVLLDITSDSVDIKCVIVNGREIVRTM